MSSLVNILALVPLALAASSVTMELNQPMIFKENDFALNASRSGMPMMSDGNCMNLETVPEYRMNVGSIYVPCPSDVQQDMMCSMYSDVSCNDELFTFTRPHENLFRQDVGDGIGKHARSMKCMIVRSPTDRQGHIFSSDHASTKSPSSCPNDSCSTAQNCQATHPGYGMYCSSSSMTCQRNSVIVDGNRGGDCWGGRCMAAAENLRCVMGSECPPGLQCRPTRVVDSLGASSVETVCMKSDDVRSKQCSSESPCAEHMMCSLQHENNAYCEWDGTCGLRNMNCISGSQCCSGNCRAQACQ